MTISHLRFGPDLIRSSYLIYQAAFVGCHQPGFLERFDVLDKLLPNGTCLVNCGYAADKVWDHLPETVQRRLIEKQARFLVIDAHGTNRR
jgi:pyruvate-ferredoxin/flavodoxin oxidoreductase